MRVRVAFPPLDFLPTLAQRRRRDFRRQSRIWLGIAACGALVSLGPMLWDMHQRREARGQRIEWREASERLRRETAVFDATGRKLAEMKAHRHAAVALVTRRQPAANRILDVMRACADGVRLTLVKTADGHLRVEGYATTQSRIRETQKRLRTLPWVRKVAEVESSVVPESLRRQWGGTDAAVTVPSIRRFTFRIELRHASAPILTAAIADIAEAEGAMTQEVPDVR